jgi:hypothetical protein
MAGPKCKPGIGAEPVKKWLGGQPMATLGGQQGEGAMRQPTLLTFFSPSAILRPDPDKRALTAVAYGCDGFDQRQP